MVIFPWGDLNTRLNGLLTFQRGGLCFVTFPVEQGTLLQTSAHEQKHMYESIHKCVNVSV